MGQFEPTGDIEKGSLWFNDLNDQLKDTPVGIICLTRDNADARWILFEAGALAKGLTTSRVCTLLIDFEHSELKRPLSEFNGTRPTKEDMFKLVETINSALAEKALPRETLDVVFDKFWSDFKDKVDSALASSAGSASSRAPRRSAEDKVEEILETVRSIHMHLQARGPNRVGSAILDDYAGSGTAGTTNPRLKPFNYLERPGIR